MGSRCRSSHISALPLAGPVFLEWYWGPLFFLFFYVPPLALGAMLVDVLANRLARRRGRQRSPVERASVAAGVVVLVTAMLWAWSNVG
jgi:hypothetical protein